MYVIAAEALLILIGGLMGYLKKGSVVSLAAGTLFAVLLGMAAYKVGERDSTIAGHQFSCLINFVLAALMGYRFASSGKFMPAGLVALLSAAVG
eukprot:CAMPEP_0174230528 /NCGR_PEP_ID=MMETSP0417-20130205/1265_1 /TAXON_ID=242541 /ORGANISM="Mayorella sp, Strain BSH-02190019" /LENGTH=93 /DNA_ID=CAMNT_0015308229 /DNA_START=85 /DNA_END=363 /DNA_ORIENTATION=-